MQPIRTLLAVSLAAAGSAQIPDGWLVVSAQSTQANGGLYLLRPRLLSLPPIGFGHSLPVSGLPPELTGLNDGVLRGANGVAIERDTGFVLVGETGPAGTNIELHRLGITAGPGFAAAVTISQTFLGVTTGSGGGVTDMELLPDGDLVLAVVGLAAQPPLNGERLARFSPATGSVTPIATNAPAGSILSVAADPTGSVLYFHVLWPGSPTPGDLVRCSVAGGAVTPMRVIAHFAGLTCDAAGFLHAVSNTFALVLDPITGSVLSSHAFNRNTQGVAIERATQRPFYLIADGNGPDGVMFDGPVIGIPGFCPEFSNDLAVKDAPVSYGTGTSGALAYAWGGVPSLNALPLPGNALFTLQIDASDSSQQLGFLVASPVSGAGVVLGANVWIDLPTSTILALTTTGVPYGVPIPTGLPAGARLFCQGAFLDATLPGGLATSDGLRVEVIQ